MNMKVKKSEGRTGERMRKHTRLPFHHVTPKITYSAKAVTSYGSSDAESDSCTLTYHISSIQRDRIVVPLPTIPSGHECVCVCVSISGKTALKLFICFLPLQRTENDFY